MLVVLTSLLGAPGCLPPSEPVGVAGSTSGSGSDTDPSGTGETSTSSATALSDSSSSGGSGDLPQLPPMCAMAVPAPDPAFSIDVGEWPPPQNIDFGVGEWQGLCTITAVEPGPTLTTTLDCSLDPEGPPLLGLAFESQGIGASWSVGQQVDVLYFNYEWSDGVRVTLRSPDDGSLLLTLIGGGDAAPGAFSLAPHLDPLALDPDEEHCGSWQEFGVVPILMTFLEPGGNAFPMLQGDTATLSGASGEQYRIELHRANAGSFNDHYDDFVDLIIRRLPQ